MSATRLETRGLAKRFGDVQAVEGLSIRVRQGEIYGFLGPNGAGKTTSIRMMAGLLRPSAGSVLADGKEVSTRASEGRRLVGLCPQENVLYPELTARENLEYAAALFDVPRARRRERATEVLVALDLGDKERTRASALSGGMKRRLTMGLAIVHEPPVVVLDEPEAGLDPQNRVAVRDFIGRLREKHCVVLTSHNMDEVERIADRVGILDRGKLVVEGTPRELKARVGRGDHLEVRLARGDPALVAGGMREVVVADVAVEGRTVSLRGLDLAKQFPALMERIARAGGEVEDVRYRGNTLEDVFLELTGRSLRE